MDRNGREEQVNEEEKVCNNNVDVPGVQEEEYNEENMKRKTQRQ